jgi:hypothetical protein
MQSTRQEETTTLRLIILRGEQVVSLSTNPPPASDTLAHLAPIQLGFGMAKSIGKGLSVLSRQKVLQRQ